MISARREHRLDKAQPVSTTQRVAILGGIRIPFCRNNTAYMDVGNFGMSVKTLGALVEKCDLHGVELGEVAWGAVIKHSSDWNLAREATLSSGLAPTTPGITTAPTYGAWNTRNVVSLKTSVHSTSSSPNRRSGLSDPNRRMASA